MISYVILLSSFDDKKTIPIDSPSQNYNLLVNFTKKSSKKFMDYYCIMMQHKCISLIIRGYPKRI